MGIISAFYRERRPLAVLAAYALVFRAVLMMLGLALAPETVAAGIGQLCLPSQSADLPSQPRGHDPATCECGPACPHGFPSAGPASATTGTPGLMRVARQPVPFATAAPDQHSTTYRQIRAPPPSFT
ncbi:hypothetical protein [Roseibium sp. RKSG952]|uniref:hypothetical protein n=1 Tax=Roseibium sp. RKSG952 TaxID=2529384 RepID=UPI0012BCD421|nr:hypothetical protein [Roseibium sp. RKSG952]MTH96116.1 hypothetical protein [Roseibium sp. RKSG952]